MMAFFEDVFENVTAMDLDTDTFKVALYNNSITPDQTVTSANSAFNAGQWATANEVFEAGQWSTGGVALSSVTSARSSNVYTFDAADTASGSTADLASVYGCLVYDDTIAAPVADQGLCYNYFGGTNSVVNGTFTVVWNASGIMTVTA
jgi:hypothetical protein